MRVWYDTQPESGQSLVETAITFIFLLLLIIGGFELAQVFSTYSAMTNAAREGSVHASSSVTLRKELCDWAPLDCDGVEDTRSSTFVCHEYRDELEAQKDDYPALYEYCTRIVQAIAARNLDPKEEYLTIGNPRYVKKIQTDPDRYRISVEVRYELKTLFSSSIELPILGRMGLPRSYSVSYTMVVESRSF